MKLDNLVEVSRPAINAWTLLVEIEIEGISVCFFEPMGGNQEHCAASLLAKRATSPSNTALMKQSASITDSVLKSLAAAA